MHTLKRIEQMLDLPDADKAQVMRELSAHYEEIRAELVASGMDPAEVQKEAETRLGDPQAIAANMNAVHCVAPWRSALIAAAPFLVSGVAFARSFTHGVWAQVMLALIVLSGVVIVAGTVRGFVRGGRPIWLPVWTAAGIIALYEGSSSAGYMLAAGKPTTFPFIVIVNVVIPGIAAIWMCRRAGRWRLAAILIPVCGIVLYYLSAYLIYLLLPVNGWLWFSITEVRGLMQDKLLSLTIAAVWVLVALRVFAIHQYGSAAQAALFVVALRLAAPSLGLADPHSAWWGGIASAILGSLTVLAFARASSFSRKIAVLGGALLARGILSTVSINHIPAQYLTMHAVSCLMRVLIGLGAIYAVVYYHRVRRTIATDGHG